MRAIASPLFPDPGSVAPRQPDVVYAFLAHFVCGDWQLRFARAPPGCCRSSLERGGPARSRPLSRSAATLMLTLFRALCLPASSRDCDRLNRVGPAAVSITSPVAAAYACLSATQLALESVWFIRLKVIEPKEGEEEESKRTAAASELSPRSEVTACLLCSCPWRCCAWFKRAVFLALLALHSLCAILLS